MASMMRCLGYPKSKALFTAWIDGLTPRPTQAAPRASTRGAEMQGGGRGRVRWAGVV